MTRDSDRTATRRAFVIGTTGTALGALAGCNQGSSNVDTGGQETAAAGNGGRVEPLTADGSSTVYPITSTGASVWNSNPPADDEEYWGPEQYDVDTDEPLADYWAGLYGFEPRDDQPPFRVNVGLSHSGTGLEKLRDGQVDLGNSSADVASEFPNASEEELSTFTDHVVARDGQPVVVSREVYDAGVEELTAEQVRGIYRGELTNWTEIDAYDGPDREIQAVGRAEGSGTDTAFRVNMLGGPDASMDGVDVRKGQNQQVKTLVERANNAVAYMALAFVTDQAPAVALNIDGTRYELGENLGASDYPLSRDLHCYTWDGTSEKEAAFLRMILSDYGQENFVRPNDYFPLPEDERAAQREKLPDPTA